MVAKYLKQSLKLTLTRTSTDCGKKSLFDDAGIDVKINYILSHITVEMLSSCNYDGLDIISFFDGITWCGIHVQKNLPCK